jgi:hypothetical protein
MIGPGAMRAEAAAAALLIAELNANAGRTPVFQLPMQAASVVALAYELGARNCEPHVAQVRGQAALFRGVTMPTFLPETA